MTQLCVGAMGHLSRERKAMRPSVDSWKKTQNHRPGSHGELISAGMTAQSKNFPKRTDDNVLIQMMKKPTKRILLLDLYKQRIGWGHPWLEVTMRLWSSGSHVEEAWQKVWLWPWTSGQLTLGSSKTSLEESDGSEFWKLGGSLKELVHT